MSDAKKKLLDWARRNKGEAAAVAKRALLFLEPTCKARTRVGVDVVACQLAEGHAGCCVNLRGEAISTRELTMEEREQSAQLVGKGSSRRC